MRQKIGDALLKKDLISREDLEKAIQLQLAYGGTLGTNLLELDLVSEEDLGRTLAEQLRVRYASPRALRNIDSATLSTLPDSLAQKHGAVPIRLEDKTLHILVADLKNLTGLSARTGCRIVPWIAPEVRVHQAMEEHFGIPGDARRAKIWQRLDERRAKASSFQPPSGAANDSSATASAAMAGSHQIDLPPRDARVAPRPESLRDRLCHGDSPRDAVAAVLDHAAKQLRTCVLFRVREGTASIWDCRGLRLDADAREAFSVPAHSGTPLELLTVYPSYKGPAPTETAYRPFFNALGIAPPAEMLLLPVKIRDRLVAILYGDNGTTQAIPGSTDDHAELTAKLSLALSMVVIKRKIRT